MTQSSALQLYMLVIPPCRLPLSFGNDVQSPWQAWSGTRCWGVGADMAPVVQSPQPAGGVWKVGTEQVKDSKPSFSGQL